MTRFHITKQIKTVGAYNHTSTPAICRLLRDLSRQAKVDNDRHIFVYFGLSTSACLLRPVSVGCQSRQAEEDRNIPACTVKKGGCQSRQGSTPAAEVDLFPQLKVAEVGKM